MTSAPALSAEKLVELLQKSVGDTGASAKPKGKQKVDLKTKLEAVNLSEDLPLIAAPQQELADRLADAAVKHPGVVTYVDLRTEARPYWAPAEGEEVDLGDEGEGSLHAFARAIAQARKGKKKQQGELFLRWNVWAASFQVPHLRLTVVLHLGALLCCSCTGWLPSARVSSPTEWWPAISARS